MDLTKEETATIIGHASRHIVLHVPESLEILTEIARVLMEFKPNLSHHQAMKDAQTIISGVNAELARQPVPAQEG